MHGGQHQPHYVPPRAKTRPQPYHPSGAGRLPLKKDEHSKTDVLEEPSPPKILSNKDLLEAQLNTAVIESAAAKSSSIDMFKEMISIQRQLLEDNLSNTDDGFKLKVENIVNSTSCTQNDRVAADFENLFVGIYP